MNNLKWQSVGLVVLVGLCVSGCKEGGPGASGYLVKAGGEARMRVAVVPFDSASLQTESAGRIVTQEVVTGLLGTGIFDVVEPGSVYQALSEQGARNIYGLDPVTMQKLQERLGPVRAYVVGVVQEYGEVRVGPATYPSISVNARVLDGQTGAILWSGSVSRTGADSEKLFGIGAVYSPGRLARAVVQDLIKTFDRRELVKLLQTVSPATTQGPATIVQPPRPTSDVPVRGKFTDESVAYGEADLKALLADVPGMTRSDIVYSEHHFSMVTATYQAQGSDLRAKVEDCRKMAAARGRVKHDHPDEADGKLDGLLAFAGPTAATMPGGYELDAAVGRFAMFLSGPATRQAEIEKLGHAIIVAMK
jgi:TolB-like protein